MKTTIELPDALFAEAKATAARQRITLKEMMEHALRRELRSNQTSEAESKCFTIDEHGLPIFATNAEPPVTSETVYRMMEDLGV